MKSGYIAKSGMKDFFEAGGNRNNCSVKDFTRIIRYDDTSNLTTFEDFFKNDAELIKIPPINTSKGAFMGFMFHYCSKLKEIPMIDTSNSVNMTAMFLNCRTIKTIPLIDTSKVTNMNQMFSGCESLINVPAINTSSVTSMYQMFNNCVALISVSFTHTENVTDMGAIFRYCQKLKEIPAWNVSNVTSFNNAFYYCTSLTAIHMTGMKANFDISYSNNLTREALVEVLNNLATVTSTRRLTMGSTNLAKLTDEDKAIATNKGWTLA